MSLLDIFRKNTDPSIEKAVNQHYVLNQDLEGLGKLKWMTDNQKTIDTYCRYGEYSNFEKQIKYVQWLRHVSHASLPEINLYGNRAGECIAVLGEYKAFRNGLESEINNISSFTNEEKELAKHLLDEIDLTYEVGVAKRLMRDKASHDAGFFSTILRSAETKMEKVLQMANNMGKTNEEITEIRDNILYSLRLTDGENIPTYIDYKYTRDVYYPDSLTQARLDFRDMIDKCTARVTQEIEALNGNDFTLS